MNNITCRKPLRRGSAKSDPFSHNGSDEQNSEGHDHDVQEEHESDDMNMSQSYKELENKIRNSPIALKNRRLARERQYSEDEHEDSIVLESANFNGQSSNGGINIKIILYSIIFPVALILLISISSFNKKSLECSYLELQERYPNEGSYLWKALQYGIEDILNHKSDKPAVYLLVHHNHSNKKARIINDIAETSSRCFGSVQVPNVKTIDFKTEQAKEDYGYIIEKYKSTIKEGNVILIANLNEISAEAAKALHAICDTVSPLVNKVIIFLSLSAKRANENEKVIDTAENALRQLWETEIMPNELDPIITRVTDQVLLMHSD